LISEGVVEGFMEPFFSDFDLSLLRFFLRFQLRVRLIPNSNRVNARLCMSFYSPVVLPPDVTLLSFTGFILFCSFFPSPYSIYPPQAISLKKSPETGFLRCFCPSFSLAPDFSPEALSFLSPLRVPGPSLRFLTGVYVAPLPALTLPFFYDYQ